MRHLALMFVGAIMSASVAFAQTEKSIEAKGPLGPLSGTLVAAKAADAPVVLIIPGSGPTDRDGNNGTALQASSYRLIAEGLYQSGISTVRIDKRGMFASAKAIADANAVTIADYVKDVETWTNVIKAATKQKCVWLLGHSEGGLVALAAAQKSNDICGLLLVATPGRPLSDVLMAQLKDNPANAPIIEQAAAAIDKLKLGQRVDLSGLHPALAGLFDPSIQGFMIDLFSYDPAKLAGNYKGPALVLQGKRDIQVNEVDAKLLADANKTAKLIVVDDVNHVLKQVKSDDIGENYATYANPNLPLAESVTKALVDFIEANGQK